MEWNKIDVNIRNLTSCNVFKRVTIKLIRPCNVFKRVTIKFIRPEPNQELNIDSGKGLKFLIRIRLGLSHLAEVKFKHRFQDLFFLSGFFFTNICDSKDSRERRRPSVYLLSTTSTHFTDTYTLAERLL